MERLTKRNGKYIEYSDENYNDSVDNLTMLDKCLHKLAEYEDAEEQGLLLKEEDVLKFYYCESEDKYLVGKRVDNFYYAEIGATGLCFTMSRYLPWGKHVVNLDTSWKEHTYPSEPVEMPFFEWLQGYITQLKTKEAEQKLAEIRGE